MARVKDIAKALNLSQATVSRALRNDETLSIAPATRAAILSTAQHMGYVSKKRPVNKKALSIVVIHQQRTFRNQIDSAYYFSVRSGIESSCAKRGIVCSFATIESIDMSSSRPDGVIVVGNYIEEQYAKIQVALPNTPMAVVGITAYCKNNFDHITFSNRETVKLALEHLFENGHSDIAYIGVEELPGSETFGSRKSTFIEMMKEKGSYKPERVLTSDHGRDRVEQGYIIAKKLVEQTPLPTAVFCANDPVALGVLKLFWEHNIIIPDDISLVSHDGCFPVEITNPPLTTVNVHPYELGVESVRCLEQRLNETIRYSRKLSLKPTLIDRNSVKSTVE